MAASLWDQIFAKIVAIQENEEQLALATQAVIDRINQPPPDEAILADALAKLTTIEAHEDAYIEALNIAAGTPPLDEIPPPMQNN